MNDSKFHHLYNNNRYRTERAYFMANVWILPPPEGNYGLCAMCNKNPATILDHKIPHKGNVELFWDAKNFQGLCTPCHSIKTATEDGGFGNPQGQPGGAPVMQDYGQGVLGTTTALSQTDQERVRRLQEIRNEKAAKSAG